MHGKMSETVRETLEKVYDEACNYYQLFKDESDRGAAVLAVARFKEQLRKAIESRDATFRSFWSEFLGLHRNCLCPRAL